MLAIAEQVDLILANVVWPQLFRRLAKYLASSSTRMYVEPYGVRSNHGAGVHPASSGEAGSPGKPPDPHPKPNYRSETPLAQHTPRQQLRSNTFVFPTWMDSVSGSTANQLDAYSAALDYIIGRAPFRSETKGFVVCS
jgi:hypothetical protein